MDWDSAIEMTAPLIGALVAGGLIGIERDYRGRPAGLRTHALVSLGSALLMVAAVHQREWAFEMLPYERIVTDPTRMAHGVLTGVGFICGGVIFREGFSVHGLTTAASLWVTSAIGVLFGIGFYSVATGGTLLTLAVLSGLQWVDNHLPGQSTVELSVRYLRDRALAPDALRSLVQPYASRPVQFSHRMIDGGRIVEHRTVLHVRGPFEADALSERLQAAPEVHEFEFSSRED